MFILFSENLLPPANEVWGKVIFSQGLWQTPPKQAPNPQRQPLKRLVRILLECILVSDIFGHGVIMILN